MQNFIDKVKEFFKDLNGEKIKNFCIDKKRYLGAVGLLVVFIIVLCVFTGGTGDSKSKKANKGLEGTETAEETITATEVKNFTFEKEFEQDKSDDMKTLINSYYEAYISANYDALDEIAKPVSDKEKSYIEVVSSYYDSIDNISYYSKKGLTDGSYLVSVYNEIKFEGVDTAAPALDFFYVETDSEGKLYINNTYSVFNQSFSENAMNPNVYALIQKYMQEEDFLKLQKETQAKYDEAVTKDEKLATMLKTTLATSIREWLATVDTAGTETSTEVSTEKTTETQKETEKTTETQKETEKTTETQKESEKTSESQAEEQKQEEVTQVKTIDIVNVRAAASADSELLGKLTAGVVLKKLGEEGDWTIVEYSGGKDGKGYIKTEFLKAVKKS